MLETLKEKIENGGIITESLLGDNEVDDMLDLRDAEDFDSEWMRVYNSIGKTELNDTEAEIIDNIRETAFMNAYHVFEPGGGDIGDAAGRVSDDFELICKAYVAGYNDKWMNALIMAYAKGIFPCGRLELAECDIKAAFGCLLGGVCREDRL